MAAQVARPIEPREAHQPSAVFRVAQECHSTRHDPKATDQRRCSHGSEPTGVPIKASIAFQIDHGDIARRHRVDWRGSRRCYTRLRCASRQ